MHYIVQTEDVCTHSTLAILVVLVGGLLSGQNPSVRLWSRRLAGAAGLLHFVGACLEAYPLDPALVLSAFARSVVAALLAFGVGLVAFAGLSCVWDRTVGYLLRRIRESRERSQRRLAEQHDATRHGTHAEDRRAQAAQEASHRQISARQVADAAERRRDARAAVTLAFVQHREQLGERFSREDLNAYLEQHLGDDHAPDKVEQRANELTHTLEALAHGKADSAPHTRETLTKWFSTQQEQIQSLSIDEKLKRFQLAELKRRYQELTLRLLEDVEP